MQIGDKIKECRNKHNLTQEKLAEMVGITRNYLSDLENNRYLPSTKTLIKLANALDMDLNFLAKNDGNTIQ